MNCLSEHSGRILKNPESNTKEELECEKIFLLCKTCPELQNILPTGLDNFLELYPKYAEILKQKFDFTVHDFYDFTGNRVYHNEREENAKRREQECLKEELQKVHKGMMKDLRCRLKLTRIRKAGKLQLRLEK